MLRTIRRDPGDLRQALDDFRKATAADPEFFKAWSRVGAVEFELGSIPRAIKSFTRALELDPTGPNTWTGRGRAFVRADEFERGAADFTLALELDPDYYPALQARAEIRGLKLGDLDGAIEDCSRAIELAPTKRKPYELRAAFYHRTGRSSLAERDLAEIEAQRERVRERQAQNRRSRQRVR